MIFYKTYTCDKNYGNAKFKFHRSKDDAQYFLEQEIKKDRISVLNKSKIQKVKVSNNKTSIIDFINLYVYELPDWP